MGKSDKKKKKLRFNPPPVVLPDMPSQSSDDPETTELFEPADDGGFNFHLASVDNNPVFTCETSDRDLATSFIHFAIRPADMARSMTAGTEYEKDEPSKKRTAEQEKNWQQKCRVMRVYNDALVSLKVSVSYDAALKMDTIDTRMAIDKLANDLDMRADFEKFLSSDDAFYAYIPCFTNGILRLNDSVHMMWEITDIDIEDHSYEAKLYVFSTHDNDPNTWWLNCMTKFKLSAEKFDGETAPPHPVISTKLTDVCQTDQLTRALNLNAVGFDKRDQDFWKNTVRRFTDDFIKELTNNYTFQFVDSTKAFLRSIVTANYFMSLTPARIPPDQRKKPNTKFASKPKAQQPAERVMRIVDCMPIISSTMPRCPTRKTVAQYRVASWQTRGHIRHYKNGKTVYVKPSVHHRKNMKNADGTRPQQIIYIRDNTDPQDSKTDG